jgi:hypothetical protein
MFVSQTEVGFKLCVLFVAAAGAALLIGAVVMVHTWWRAEHPSGPLKALGVASAVTFWPISTILCNRSQPDQQQQQA